MFSGGNVVILVQAADLAYPDSRRIGQRLDSAGCISKNLTNGAGKTHHLEGVDEGKSMVLGVGLMLSLFVFDR